MLYGRWVNGEDSVAELLLLSTEESKDDEALVHIYTGVDLIPALLPLITNHYGE